VSISGKGRWYLGVAVQGIVYVTGSLWLLTLLLYYFDNVSLPGDSFLGLIMLSEGAVICSSMFLSFSRPRLRLVLFLAGCIMLYLAYLSVGLVPRVSA
jgi:hypothetical protein